MWITPISYAIGPKCRRLKVKIKLPPFSIYCEQAFVYFNQ